MSSAQSNRRTSHFSDGGEMPSEPRYHHGRSPAAWAGSLSTLVAVVLFCAGLLLKIDAIMIAAVVLLVVGLIAARALQAAGKGNV